jgi:hypothetical protein
MRGSSSSMARVIPLMVSVIDRLIQCSIRAMGERLPSTDGIRRHAKSRQIRPHAFPGSVAALGMKMLWVSVAARRYGGYLRLSRSPKKPRTRQPSYRKTFGNKTLDKRVPRKPRVDALRNRDRLLKAAKTVLSAGGPDASLEAVARAAGVGIGTLYRHFPTREALFEAVYRHEVQQLADLAE